MNWISGYVRLFLSSILLLVLLLFHLLSYGQLTEARVKAALIYNFAQNVEWGNSKSISSYTIGVVSSDTTIISELKNLSRAQKINNKPILVSNKLGLTDLQDVQILYIDEFQCSSISDFYSQIIGKNILLISDKCTSKLFIMINILYDAKSQTLSYEINRQNLDNERFTLKPEILVHGGSYVDIKGLYIETYNQLREETKRIQEIQAMLEVLRVEKDSFQIQANLLYQQIDELLLSKENLERKNLNVTQNLKEKDSLLIIRSKALDQYVNQSRLLQEKINTQLGMLDDASINLLILNRQIEEKQLELDEKQQRIEGQNQVLTEKESVINVQQKLIWVSVALAFFMFFALFMIYRAYKTKKQMNIRLEKLVDIRTNELQLSREHFKNLFESSPVSICEMDLSNFFKFISGLGKTPTNIIKSIETNAGLVAQSIGQIKINDVNSATLNLFGFKSKKEFIDNYIKTFNDQALVDFQQTIKSFVLKQSNYTYETVRLTSNSEIKYIQVSWIVLPGFAENYGRVIVTMTDITEIKKHRDHLEELVNERSAKIIHLNRELTDTVEELENTVQKLQETQNHLIRAEKMASLGMLTAGIAHEINNPINYISASSQALTPLLNQIWTILGEVKKRKVMPTDEADHLNSVDVEELSSSIKFLVDNIEIGIKKTTEIISSLVTYSRTGEMAFSEYDIISGIKDALVILHSKYSNRIVVIENYDRIPLVKCNATSINQLIMNLLSNAIDSIPDKGRIEVSLSHSSESNEVILSVKDTGTGIPENHKVKIFDPFYTTKEVGKGTGLGLYITYGIVQQHGGRIEVNSVENEGSEFVVTLPINSSQVS